MFETLPEDLQRDKKKEKEKIPSRSVEVSLHTQTEGGDVVPAAGFSAGLNSADCSWENNKQTTVTLRGLPD